MLSPASRVSKTGIMASLITEVNGQHVWTGNRTYLLAEMRSESRKHALLSNMKHMKIFDTDADSKRLHIALLENVLQTNFDQGKWRVKGCNQRFKAKENQSTHRK